MMKNYILKDIPGESYFTKTVFLDGQFVLAAPEMPFSGDLIKALTAWDFREVYSDGEPREDYVAEGSGDIEEGEILDAAALAALSDGDKIKRAGEFYKAFQKYVETLFTKVAIKNELDFKSVAEKIKAACDIVREDRRFLMRAQKNSEPAEDQNYLASHAVRSTIIAIIIGSYLKLPAHRLIELGVAALLHEIGMIKLPPQIYISKRPLTPQERKAILTHPVLSFNLLKSFDFPLVISLAALEHHERENGSGYPQKLTGDKISLYAKIIAVACSYEALSTARPHKEAKDGYEGMLELLKNEGKQYDDTVVRALVFSLSIYPIGLYVLLSSGKKGQVVDVSPENPRYPIVQVFGELNPDGKNKTLETSQTGIYIVRPLTREEIGN
ncbi:MAG: HD-GYP domain-containing protein [Treponema sp.]|jgi:HD-GYP domain-containing protein (c-di-GMP phosphodiesterase class II)|nr:HD-GYP domain-containing protein [Treponema sp.]